MTIYGPKEALRSALAEVVSGSGDFGEMPDMAADLAEIIRPFAAADFECLMTPLPPTPPAVFKGVDGIVRAWQDFASSFRSVTAQLNRALESDTAMLLLVDITYVTEHGAVQIAQPAALVVMVDGQLVTEVQFHLDQDAALKAGGL